MKDIKKIAKALSQGEIQEALTIKENMGDIDMGTEIEICEIVRQAIIKYLKKGEIYNARAAESAFDMEQDSIDETVRQAVMSIFREGDMEKVAELRDGLPISKIMADELVDYCASWGNPGSTACMKAVFA
ncbi:MAG TPA: hypothetical protein VHD69_02355 [Candidatus Paceibacterota bacterium]|jgi:hypothetical protein|nr:hypothetical protein [Candidatus Paceibacterota bacterium]